MGSYSDELVKNMIELIKEQSGNMLSTARRPKRR